MSSDTRKVPINMLQPGDAFRLLVGIGRYEYGHLIFHNLSRARVVMYDQKRVTTKTIKGRTKGEKDRYIERVVLEDEETNVPRDMEVEPIGADLKPIKAEEREAVVEQDDVKAAGIRAKYRYQQKQLAQAMEAGQADKVEVCKSRIAQIETEARNAEIDLPVYDEERTTHTEPRVAVKSQEIEDDPAVKKAREKSKAAKEKGLTKKAMAEYKARDRSAPAKASRATHNCICGCERETGSLYAPGHDARVKGILLKIERGELAKDTIPAQVAPFVKWTGKWNTDNFRLAAAPVKIPGRPEVENTTLKALEALDV